MWRHDKISSIKCHIIATLTMGNVHRSGVTINFLLQDFLSGQTTVDGHVTFSVREHKITSTHGYLDDKATGKISIVPLSAG